MFGYIICNKKGLSKEEQKRYQEVYCGLCQSLKNKFGQTARFSLNFDMTFLALFLMSLYLPEENRVEFSCPIHPLKRRVYLQNKFIDYAADMTIVLSYFKCLDDWKDERKRMRLQYGKVLEKKYLDVKQRYPRQCQNVAASLQKLSVMEKTPEVSPDAVVNCSGKMLSELFVLEEDFWSNSLRLFGFELGRFIYLMDAAMDYHQDIKKQTFNPLFLMRKQPEEMEELLTECIGEAAKEFEKLPIVDDAHLIRNILYGGVWQKYYAKYKGKEISHGG